MALHTEGRLKALERSIGIGINFSFLKASHMQFGCSVTTFLNPSQQAASGLANRLPFMIYETQADMPMSTELQCTSWCCSEVPWAMAAMQIIVKDTTQSWPCFTILSIDEVNISKMILETKIVNYRRQFLIIL